MKKTSAVILVLIFVLILILTVTGAIRKIPIWPLACGYKTCEGTDGLSCGSNIPRCGLEADFTDPCRDLAYCDTSFGRCKLVKTSAFEGCVRCAEDCLSQVPEREEFVKEDFIDPSDCFDECLAALYGGDPCNEIPKSKNRDRCYNIVAYTSNNVDACDKIDSRLQRDTCIAHRSQELKNPEYCSRIEDSLRKITCILGAGGEIEDYDICEGKGSQSDRDACYKIAAKNLGETDERVCEKIKTAGYKENCLRTVRSNNENLSA